MWFVCIKTIEWNVIRLFFYSFFSLILSRSYLLAYGLNLTFGNIANSARVYNMCTRAHFFFILFYFILFYLWAHDSLRSWRNSICNVSTPSIEFVDFYCIHSGNTCYMNTVMTRLCNELLITWYYMNLPVYRHIVYAHCHSIQHNIK